MQGMWIVIGIIGLLVGGSTVALRGTRRRVETWEQAAAALGLELVARDRSSGLPGLTGALEGVAVRVHMEVEHRPRPRRGDEAIYFICVSASLGGPLPFELQIYNQIFFQKDAAVAREQDIQVGDDELDAKFVFRANAPDALRHMVREPQVRQALLSGLKVARSLRVEANTVGLRERSQAMNVSQLTCYIESCAVLARAIGDAARASR